MRKVGIRRSEDVNFTVLFEERLLINLDWGG